jgi:MFS family permease
MLLNSVLFSFYGPASQAYIADVTTEERRLSAFGLLRMGGNFGWALGPALGGVLAQIDYSYLFFFTALCMLAAFFVLHFFGRESLVQEQKGPSKNTGIKDIFSVVKDTHYLVFTIICLVIFTVWGQLVSPLSIYTVNRIGITKLQLGFLFSVNGFMVAFLQYFITHLIPQKKVLSALWIGSLVYAAGYFSVGFAGGFYFLVFSMAIITVAEMIITPATQSYASIIADPGHRGRYMGFLSLSQTLGWAFGPLIGGIMLDTFQGENFYIWTIVAGIAVLAAVGFLVFKKKLISGSLPASYSRTAMLTPPHF